MKSILFLTAMLFISIIARPQQPQPKLSYYDSKGNSTKEKKAKFMGVLRLTNDSAWEYAYYKFKGPLIHIKTYRDEPMTQPHGYHAYFDEGGRIDSAGLIKNGVRDSVWEYFNDDLSSVRTRYYENGKPVKTEPVKSGPVTNKIKRPSFPGGQQAWGKFLSLNLLYPEDIDKYDMAYTVIRFRVDTSGKTDNLRIMQSAKYSYDNAAMDCLKKMPAWVPASKDGVPDISYVSQPITFQSY